MSQIMSELLALERAKLAIVKRFYRFAIDENG
jgi:hypothetical protein